MPVQIEIATNSSQYEIAKGVFIAYARFLDVDLGFQGFSQEMRMLPEMYGSPNGCLLLAKKDQEYIGAVGLREYEPNVAEMKRMFVYQEHQGIGAGNALIEAFINEAKALGYHSIKLDSLGVLDKALGLYRKYGFTEIEPYRHNPYADAIFMELSLL